MLLPRLFFSAFAYLSLAVNAAAQDAHDAHLELLRGTIDKVSCNELSSINALVNQLVHQSQEPAALLSAFMQQQQAKQTLCAIEASHVNTNSGVARSELFGAISLTPDVQTLSQNANLDTRAPELVSITLSKRSINLADGPQQVEVVLRARDESGMGQSILFAYAPEGFESNFNQLKIIWSSTGFLQPHWQATTEPDVFEARLVLSFDAQSPAGVWNIRPFTLVDGLGNETPIITTQQMLDWGFDTNLTVSNEKVIDMTPPELLSVTLSKQQVDMALGPQQVEVVLRARDKNGMGQSALFAYAPEGFKSNFNQIEIIWNTTSTLHPRWQATTEPDVFEARLVLSFDAQSPAGVWNIRPFTLVDGLGNETPIITTQQMLDWGFNTDLVVVNEEVIDVTPPELVSITVSKQQVDMTVGPQQVEVVLRARDKSGMGQSILFAYAPEGFSSNFNQLQTIWSTASAQDPRWQATAEPDVYQASMVLTFDALSPSGVWHIRPFTLVDSLGNETPIISR